MKDTIKRQIGTSWPTNIFGDARLLITFLTNSYPEIVLVWRFHTYFCIGVRLFIFWRVGGRLFIRATSTQRPSGRMRSLVVMSPVVE